MTTTYSETVVLEKTDCPSCGICFSYPAKLRQKHRENGAKFYCPNGHGMSFTETEVQRLQKELAAQTEATNREREHFFDEQRKHEETQRKMLLAKKRSSAGTCPCCKRTFSQMARHMKTKHPDYPGKP